MDGQYQVIQRIAVGGMAEIYLGMALGEGGFTRPVVIKKVHRRFSNDERFVLMLIKEAKISAALNHPNIVQILDLGRNEENEYFIVMEYVEGHDLRGVIDQAAAQGVALGLDRSLYIVSEVCAALSHAHRKTDENGQHLNLIHRDVSPSNILISFAGEVKLTDFGIARYGREESVAGSLKGKLAYMAPEQARGRSGDLRSDIYAIGTVLFELILGRRVFLAEREQELLEEVREARIPLPSAIDPLIPLGLEHILLRALAPNPAQRFQSAEELQLALRSFQLRHLSSRVGAMDLAELLGQLFDGSRSPSPETASVQFTINTMAPHGEEWGNEIPTRIQQVPSALLRQSGAPHASEEEGGEALEGQITSEQRIEGVGLEEVDTLPPERTRPGWRLDPLSLVSVMEISAEASELPGAEEPAGRSRSAGGGEAARSAWPRPGAWGAGKLDEEASAGRSRRAPGGREVERSAWPRPGGGGAGAPGEKEPAARSRQAAGGAEALSALEQALEQQATSEARVSRDSSRLSGPLEALDTPLRVTPAPFLPVALPSPSSRRPSAPGSYLPTRSQDEAAVVPIPREDDTIPAPGNGSLLRGNTGRIEILPASLHGEVDAGATYDDTIPTPMSYAVAGEMSQPTPMPAAEPSQTHTMLARLPSSWTRQAWVPWSLLALVVLGGGLVLLFLWLQPVPGQGRGALPESSSSVTSGTLPAGKGIGTPPGSVGSGSGARVKRARPRSPGESAKRGGPPAVSVGSESGGPPALAKRGGPPAVSVGSGSGARVKRARPPSPGEPAKRGGSTDPSPGEGEPPTGKVVIRSAPEAQIYVDGANSGLTTSARPFPLPAGIHQIDLVNPALNLRWRLTITVRPDIMVNEFIRLQ